MKTLIYLPTLLAFLIHGMVNGQTNGNPVYIIRVDIMGQKMPVINTKSEIDPLLFINQLRCAALTALPNEKQLLLNEAHEQEDDFVYGQIQKSESEARVKGEQFNTNKFIILTLLDQVRNQSSIITQVKIFCKEANRCMQQALEIREEAKAQLYPAATLGEMSNAEEKEVLAITLQGNCLNLLENANSEISYVIK